MYLATRYWTSGGQQSSRPLRHYSLVRPNNLPGLTVLYSVTANNLPGHTSISINGQTTYLSTNTTSCRLTPIIYTTHTLYHRQTHVRTLSIPATTPLHLRSRRQWRDPVGSPKVNVDLYYFPKYFRQTTSNSHSKRTFNTSLNSQMHVASKRYEVCRPLLPAELVTREPAPSFIAGQTRAAHKIT